MKSVKIERKIEVGSWRYYVDGKLVDDELELPIKERIAFRDFKKLLRDGMFIKSKIYNIK